jgi:hypothetical protein
MDNYQNILKTKRKIEDGFLNIDGIHGLSIGYEQLESSYSNTILICFHVHNNELLESGVIPKEIHGIRTSVIKTDIPKPLGDFKKYKPLTGGIRIETEDHMVGTLGCIIRDKKSGRKVGLSCKHILTSKDYTVGHPAFMANNYIGHTVRGALSKNIDAAICSIENTEHELTIAQIGELKGWHRMTIKDIKYGGFPVRKRGMATGLTFGLIKNIHYTGIRSDGWKFSDQFWIEGYEKIFSSEGDSGSVYVDTYNRVIGLHWGCEGYHTGLGSPIENVLTELELEPAFGYENTELASQSMELYNLVI